MGKYVKKFESLLEEDLNNEVACVSSGTAAIHLALEGLCLPKGSHVLVPSLTYVATYQAITASGLIPIPIDCELESGNISVSTITNSKSEKTKVIVPVLYSGDTANYREVLNWANENDLRVVCDAAHAFGSKDQDELIGSFGDITCFSFDGIKNITSGEGGAVVASDKKLMQKIKDKRLLGVEKDTEKRYSNERSWQFNVRTQGWRYHMSNVHASIGISQFKRREHLFKSRKRLAQTYDKCLSQIENIKIFNRDYNEIVPHIYPILLKNKMERDNLAEYLRNNKIQCGIHYMPNHYHSFFGVESYNLPNTNYIAERVLSLPLHTKLTKKEQRHTIEKITVYFK